MRSIKHFTEYGHPHGSKCDEKSQPIFTIQLFHVVDLEEDQNLLFTTNCKDLQAIFLRNFTKTLNFSYVRHIRGNLKSI